MDWIRVGKQWSRVISRGCVQVLSKEFGRCRDLVIVIPGNPGVDQFYADFADDLLKNVTNSSETAVFVLSHLNHVGLPSELEQNYKTQHSGNEIFLLSSQIDHKLQLIREYIPKTPRIFLVGHSIGCYIILKILPYLLKDGYSIQNAFLLFPTIENMADTPNGKWLSTFAYLGFHKILLPFGILLDYFVPSAVKKLLFDFHEGKKMSENNSEAVCEVLSYSTLRNVVYMGLDELKNVGELESELIVNDFSEKLLFYCATKDPWCPLAYAYNLRKILGDKQVIICDSECEHAFVLSHSDVMARKVAQWMDTVA